MTDRLDHVEVETGEAGPLSPEMRQEQQVAIFDLLEENHFALPEATSDGPYALTLTRDGGRLSFDVTAKGMNATRFELSLGPMRQIVKDYNSICESYYEAVKTSGAGEIEALDEARRGIHGEGARVLQDRLAGRADVDTMTAKRLFTLVCVLLNDG